MASHSPKKEPPFIGVKKTVLTEHWTDILGDLNRPTLVKMLNAMKKAGVSDDAAYTFHPSEDLPKTRIRATLIVEGEGKRANEGRSS